LLGCSIIYLVVTVTVTAFIVLIVTIGGGNYAIEIARMVDAAHCLVDKSTFEGIASPDEHDGTAFGGMLCGECVEGLGWFGAGLKEVESLVCYLYGIIFFVVVGGVVVVGGGGESGVIGDWIIQILDFLR